ncbi:Na+ H+ antiporter NhaC [Levilactobacillus senmaizukei DSM 21775 = NBRC 103853]|uniref:Na+ H+ antiporter NhaC n=1 Tax=Levilactobacillus senmaizukei DSM 21775 = NBRC 103853 TaxID=1423803 RepID=A0A0R2DED6_9LACO|nr:Na+/H+ antiporter NhaC [Levilactobacillus senmaizukei]KRN02306.1 Na+ H+ antiporter NhaC [Levilactobacillus senmaizukei DSM 21775 = NBRC 103853]
MSKKEKKVRVKKEPTFIVAVLPIVAMILLLGLGYGFFHIGPEVLMLTSAAIAALIAYFLGYSWDEIQDNIVDKIAKTMPAILILIVVGFLIGTWMIGGTIPMMIYFGLKLISPKFIIVTAFVVTSFVSLCTGTSWGSTGTIGVAIMGVAASMGAPLPIVAGAVVSGAYFGDKISPLSGSTNLAPIAAGAELYEHIRHLLWTTIPGVLICLVVYTMVGLNLPDMAGGNSDKIQLVEKSIHSLFNMNFWILIPIVIVLVGSALQKPTIPVMLLSSTLAILNAVFIQHFDIKSAAEAAVTGFTTDMLPQGVKISADLTTLLERGGMISMLSVVLIALCAYGFAGALDVSHSLTVVLNAMTKAIRSTGQLIATAIFSTMLVTGVTSNGQLAELLPGEMFRDIFVKYGLEPKNLSRTVEDAGTMIEPIIPWTAAGVYMASTLGVDTMAYLPWAILCYTGTIFALIYAFTGIGVAKITKKSRFWNEYQERNGKPVDTPSDPVA